MREVKIDISYMCFRFIINLKGYDHRLNKSNWRQFFTDLQLWLQSRGLFYFCENEKEDKCSWRSLQGQSNKNKKDEKEEIVVFSAGIEDLVVDKNRSLNTEKASQWDKDASAVMYWLRQCCTYDIDIIEEQRIPKNS